MRVHSEDNPGPDRAWEECGPCGAVPGFLGLLLCDSPVPALRGPGGSPNRRKGGQGGAKPLRMVPLPTHPDSKGLGVCVNHAQAALHSPASCPAGRKQMAQGLWERNRIPSTPEQVMKESGLLCIL